MIWPATPQTRANSIMSPTVPLILHWNMTFLEYDTLTWLSGGEAFERWYIISYVDKIWTNILKMCENLLVRTQPCPVKPASVPSTCNQCYDVYISCKGNSKRLHIVVTSSRNIVIIFCSMYVWNTHAENEYSTIGWKSGQHSNISKGMLLTSYFLQRMDGYQWL